MAYMTHPITQLGTKPAPFVAQFSSRGPNTIQQKILKVCLAIIFTYSTFLLVSNKSNYLVLFSVLYHELIAHIILLCISARYHCTRVEHNCSIH
jgi:hypothetical protein